MNSKVLLINSTFYGFLIQRFGFRRWLNLLIPVLVLFNFPQILLSQSLPDSLKMGQVLVQQDKISGNFGEFRSNHFHSGIDYKTGEKEGLPVFAAADGYVSRVKISAVGYGRAVYITHPDNIVTVYGHLRIYYAALEDTIRKLQFSKQDYEVELFPDSGLMLIRKGELIGYSGNTGGSEGPHLHFETRHAQSEKPFNPVAMGYSVVDTVPPLIKALAVYNPGPEDGLAGATRQIINIAEGKSGLIEDTLLTGARFFVGIETYDKAGVEENQIGIHSWNMFFDDSLIFSASIDSFSFSETRMVNATIDYPWQQDSGQKIILCHALKGNKLSFLENKNGMVLLNDFKLHKVVVKVMDNVGNFSETGCHIMQNPDAIKTAGVPEGTLCLYEKAQKIISKNYRIDISPQSFYEDIRLVSTEKLPHTDKVKNETVLNAPIISIKPAGIPIQDPIVIAIKPDIKKSVLQSQLIAVLIDSTGRMQGFKSTFEKGWIVFKTRTLGDFSVTLDTIPPLMKTPVWEADDFTGKKRLILGLESDLSGIASYKCYINDVWVPAVLATNRIIIYPEDLPETAEPINLKVILIDGAGNETTANLVTYASK